MRQDRRSPGRVDVDRNGGQVGDVELPDGTDREDHQAQQRDGGDHEHHLERLTDTGQVDADEERVGRQIHPPAVVNPEEPQRFHVGADERRDGGGGDRVLDEDRGASGEAAPRAERATGEGVPTAGGRQRRGQLGHAQHQGEVHAGDDHGSDGEAAETAVGQTEIPAGVVAGDHVADAETGEQQPAGRALLQLTFREVFVALDVLFDTASGVLTGWVGDGHCELLKEGWRMPNWPAPQESSGAGLDHCVAERFWKASTEKGSERPRIRGVRGRSRFVGATRFVSLRARSSECSFPRASARQKNPWAFVEYETSRFFVCW